MARNLVGTPREVQKLLAGLLSNDEISEIIGEPEAIRRRLDLGPLLDDAESVMANYLAEEHPQTAAYILRRS